jgi:perosamine synthetase
VTLTAADRCLPDKYSQSYPDDLTHLADALERGLSGSSVVVSDYEAALADWFDLPCAVATSSGTAALTVALAAVGVSPGDEVVMSPTAPLCTVYPIMEAGAVPVFVDVHDHGFGIDLDCLAQAITDRTRAVIEIPMWGYPTEVDLLQQGCRARGLPLILDLAHAHGTKLNRLHLAQYGTLSCFSTHERKPLATGEGGFILTDNTELATACRSYSRFGNLEGLELGMNYKLAALPAALGSGRLRLLRSQLETRRANAKYFLDRLDHPAVREMDVIEGAEPNYYALVLRLAFEDNKRFIDHLDAHGIPSDIKRYGCRCLYEFPAVAGYRADCPRATRLLETITTIPVHPGVSQSDLDYAVGVVNGYGDD